MRMNRLAAGIGALLALGTVGIVAGTPSAALAQGRGGWHHDRSASVRLNSLQGGDGNIGVKGAKDRDIDQARVNLDRGGSCEITFYNHRGHQQDVFTGTAGRPDNNGNVHVNLTGEIGHRTCNVSGTVNLRTKDWGKFDRIQLDGSSRDGKAISIHFTAK